MIFVNECRSVLSTDMSFEIWYESRRQHNILEPTTEFTFFNSGFKSDPRVISFYSTGITDEKRFPPPNFNLKIVRIQRGSGSWMLLDAVLHC
jgi:aminopeptidase-like protein